MDPDDVVMDREDHAVRLEHELPQLEGKRFILASVAAPIGHVLKTHDRFVDSIVPANRVGGGVFGYEPGGVEDFRLGRWRELCATLGGISLIPPKTLR